MNLKSDRPGATAPTQHEVCSSPRIASTRETAINNLEKPLPSLESPLPINDVTARYLLDARKHVRDVGHDAILKVLSDARDTSNELVDVVHWSFGQRSTYGGREDRKGCGGASRWPLVSHVKYLELLAPAVHPKGEGPCRTLGVSRFRGSSDAEFVSRSGLFLDCDGCGDANPLLTVLNSIGIAYIFQCRPKTDRWHIELFYSSPLAPPNSEMSGVDLRMWKNLQYRPIAGWLMGLFSEIGALDCRFENHQNGVSISKLGADAAPGNRLLSLGNPYTRRSPGEPIPETHFRDDAFLNVERLLAATGFAPPVAPPPRSPRRQSPPQSHTPSGDSVADGVAEDPADSLYEPADPEDATPSGAAMIRAFEASNLLIQAVKGLGITLCPFRDGHTQNEGVDTGTAVLPNGFVKCHHASCGNRTQADFFNKLSDDAQEVVFQALPDMAIETEDALFSQHVLQLASRRSTTNPLQFMEMCKRLAATGAPVGRWTAHVRKERRS